MSQSEQINELAAALAKAQGAMKAATKDTENSFFKSRYADLAAVMAVAREPLSKNSLAVIQSPNYEGDSVWIETTVVHSSGQWVASKYPVRPVKNDPQGIGSAISYARRYSLMAMVGIVADDGSDDDGNAASGKDAEPPTKPDRKAAAITWANDALGKLQTFTRAEDLSAWHKANANAVAAVRGFNEALHERLVNAIQKRQADLNPLGA